jgi:hypothetical protein
MAETFRAAGHGSTDRHREVADGSGSFLRHRRKPSPHSDFSPPAARSKPEQDDHAGTLLGVLTLFGACAVTFMVLMYALERRGRDFILAFACGCVLSSVYGFLAGTWPFGIVEAIWAVIALKRYRSKPPMYAHSTET